MLTVIIFLGVLAMIASAVSRDGVAAWPGNEHLRKPWWKRW
jgi:hypothetical protein